MKILTFYDFTYRSRHALKGRSKTAAHPHWHTYTVRLWFTGKPDQDQLSETIEDRFALLHGADIGHVVKDTTDEGLAEWFLRKASDLDCIKVLVTNDGRRGAEAQFEENNDIPEPDWGTEQEWEAYRKARTR